MSEYENEKFCFYEKVQWNLAFVTRPLSNYPVILLSDCFQRRKGTLRCVKEDLKLLL